MISFSLAFRRKISFACSSMSLACPPNPPLGWWIMMREWGREKRFPFAPAASRSAPIEAAMPMQVVETCGFTYCIVS